MINTRIGVLSTSYKSAVPTYTVTFNAKLDSVNPPLFDPQFYISTDEGVTYSLQGSLIDSTSCSLKYTGFYASGSSITVKIVDPSNDTVVCRFGRALTSATCPAVSTFTLATFTVSGNRDTAFTVQAP